MYSHVRAQREKVRVCAVRRSNWAPRALPRPPVSTNCQTDVGRGTRQKKKREARNPSSVYRATKIVKINQYDFHHLVHPLARKGCGREARNTDFLQVLAVALKPFIWVRCNNMTRILYDISEMSCPWARQHSSDPRARIANSKPCSMSACLEEGICSPEQSIVDSRLHIHRVVDGRVLVHQHVRMLESRVSQQTMHVSRRRPTCNSVQKHQQPYNLRRISTKSAVTSDRLSRATSSSASLYDRWARPRRC